MTALALVLISAGLAAAQADSPGDRVTVLDAGTFLVVEAHGAPLGEVLQHLETHLKITFANRERVELSRIVDGRRVGTALDVMRWLVPNHSFVLLYEERTPGDTRKPRLERIGFLNMGAAATTGGSAPLSTAGVPPEGVPGGVTRATKPASPGGVLPGSGTPDSEAATAGDPDLRHDGSKPDRPSTRTTEIRSVAEQLRAATPEARLEVERDAHAPGPRGAPPEFLRPHSDAAQTTLQQQAERSQALAVEQLRALMDALKAACQGATGDGPC